MPTIRPNRIDVKGFEMFTRSYPRDIITAVVCHLDGYLVGSTRKAGEEALRGFVCLGALRGLVLADCSAPSSAKWSIWCTIVPRQTAYLRRKVGQLKDKTPKFLRTSAPCHS